MSTMVLDPIDKLTKDLKAAALTLGEDEARFLVDAYYSMQEQRIRAANQVNALKKSCEPNEVLDWYMEQSERLERSVRSALDAYSSASPLGRWAKGICGIGPVIAAGLLAHIDCTKPTAGHIWRFAGLDPTVKWEKGKKRPWNASLKALSWKAGESFIKVQNNPHDFYGRVYVEHKARYAAANEAGKYADTAAAIIAAKRIGRTTEAHGHYSAGHLPPAHIHARARRVAVKLFLSHYHTVGHWLATGRLPPRCYPIDILGHAHEIAPPNMEMVEGLREAWEKR